MAISRTTQKEEQLKIEVLYMQKVYAIQKKLFLLDEKRWEENKQPSVKRLKKLFKEFNSIVQEEQENPLSRRKYFNSLVENVLDTFERFDDIVPEFGRH